MNYKHILKIEELSMNAWPSYKIELYDKWLIRFSHQYTYRTNCVEQVGPSEIDIEKKIDYCEEIYKEYKTPANFKINPIMPESFDKLLESRGYEIKHVTNVMTMSLDNFNHKPDPNIDIILSDTITDDWITGLFTINGTTNKVHLAIVPSMFKAIPKRTFVACIKENGRMVASGLGILDRDDLGVYAIYVAESERKKGYAKSICATIINKGIEMGAKYSYLQVVKGNSPTINLYESLGYKYDYTYWFRSKETH